MNPFTPGIESTLDLEAVLNAGLDRASEALRVDGGWIALDVDLGLEVACRRGISEEYAMTFAGVPCDEPVTDSAFTRRATVIAGDPSSGSRVPPAAALEGIRTMLALPLEVHGGVLGVLVVLTRRPRTYSTGDLSYAGEAAAELAATIEHALLFREQVDRIDRQRLLLEATETVNRSIDSASLETIILAEATRLVDAQHAALLVVRGDVLVAKEVYALDERYKQLFVVPLAHSLFGQAVLNGETETVGDVTAERWADAYLGGEGGYRAVLTTPLQSFRGTYGALAVFYDRARRFREAETMLFRTFAIHATIALDNRRLIQEKDQMAVRDGLTGVYNRSYLELTLERATKEVRRNGGVVSILFLDLDDMKKVNDDHGHQVGDRLLRELAALLGQSCRETDIVARYGGDEFVVLMPGTDQHGARRVALKVDEGIARYNASRKGPVALSASMGLHTAGGADINDLLHEADRRMYAMKRSRAAD